MVDENQKLPTRFRPISSYRGLVNGVNSSRRLVEAVSVPLDGTKQGLRDSRLGSPFTFRVAPPEILLSALMGGGEAQTQSAFDPLLRQAFDDALNNLEVVLEQFEIGQATAEDVEAARQGLLGTRAPAQGQNINIIEAANRSTNNFSQVVQRRSQFRQQSNFYALSDERPGLYDARKFVGANGVSYEANNEAAKAANQTAVSDLTQALDVIIQLNQLLNTPSLTLLVNPQTLTLNYAKKQQYQDRNRFNYLFQSWGEEQMRLQVSGRTAGFVVGSKGIGELDATRQGGEIFQFGVSKTKNVSGYQWASKLDSAAWQNFMALFQFYRNNGYIYDTVGSPRSEAHLFIGSIEIIYDQWVYVGNFENFQYQYDETRQQGALEFSFEFVASQIYDLSKSGVSPVRPYSSPPTPSPSQAPEDAFPVLTEPAARTARELPSVSDTTPSTAIFDQHITPSGRR